MDPVTVATIIRLLAAANEAAGLATKALDAANNGDEEAAREYLDRARAHYDTSRAAWDAAGA